MVYFHPVIYTGEPQHFPHGRVPYLVDVPDELRLGIDDAVLVLEEGRQVTAGDIAVLIDAVPSTEPPFSRYQTG